MKKIILLFSVIFHALLLNGQINVPAASPLVKMTQQFGIHEITMEYSRPSVKGRDIFSATGLVPFGEYWRTGANSPTKMTLKSTTNIGGQALATGTYVLLTIPDAKEWTVLFYPLEKGGWNKYIERTPTIQLKVPVISKKDNQENLLIQLDNIKKESAELVIHWANTAVAIPVTVSIHEEVMANIERVMSGPSDFDYFWAATYLQESQTDLPLALAYIQKTTKGKKPRFFFWRREALILADLGRYEEAIAAAKESIRLGELVGNIDVVKVNNISIQEWKGRK